MKRKFGISLIVLVIAMIVMVIIAGAVIITLTNTNLIVQADTATTKYNKQQYKQIIGNEFAMLKTSEEAKGKTTEEKYAMLKAKLNLKELNWEITSNAAYITVSNQYILTLFEDGTIKEGKTVLLDVANGSIDIYADRYIQGEKIMNTTGYTNYKIDGKEIFYQGEYIITGTTTEDAVRIRGKGTYNITLKDLTIDMSQKPEICPFNANRDKITTDLCVNLYLEGTTSLKANKNAAGLGFGSGTPNLNGITNGSTLTIQGEGNLYAEGGVYGAGIGTAHGASYEGAVGEANNIIINSGNIVAKSGGSITAAIGGGTYSNVTNIVINGGNVHAICTSSGVALGTARSNNTATSGLVKGLVINGGNVILEGKSTAIGGEINSEDILIKGGRITLKNTGTGAVIGNNCTFITMTGGTIVANSVKGTGIGTKDVTECINITGGSLYLETAGDKHTVPPTSGENNVYLTELQLQNVTEEIQVTSFTTSDNLSYGIKDMYTTADGKLYVYLPTGERLITIKAGNKEYTGTVVTGEADATEAAVLNEK